MLGGYAEVHFHIAQLPKTGEVCKSWCDYNAISEDESSVNLDTCS